MDQLVRLIAIPNELPFYLAIDIAIAVVLLFVVRSISGLFSSVSVRRELGEKDNFAFGVSLAGRMLALTIVLSAVVGRNIGESYREAALSMIMFGVMGILLIRIGRFAHDKLVLDRLDKNKMISEKNVSVALVDGSAAVASAIIVKSIIEWSVGSDTNTFIAVFSGGIVVLVVLLFATRFYEYSFAENNQNSGFQRTLANGQIALAIQHSGNLIGIAIAVSSASKVLVYSPTTYVTNMTGWLISGITLAASLMILTSIVKRIVLVGVSWRKEVVLHHNIGIASVEASLSIGIALLFTNVFL
jgi:uncharacterized membrane protein YjfL (UPF0719 family)